MHTGGWGTGAKHLCYSQAAGCLPPCFSLLLGGPPPDQQELHAGQLALLQLLRTALGLWGQLCWHGS